MAYHGIYMSSVTSTTGCNKQFASDAQETMQLPPRVSTDCDMCNKNHSFRLVRTYHVSTPSQRVQFHKYCDIMSIERDVEIEQK